MSFFCKAGQFTMNLGAGNQSITGLGFTPKLVIFMSNDEDVNEINTHWIATFGAMDNAGNQFCITANSEDAQATSDCSYGYWITACMESLEVGTTTVDYIATYVSMDADGFTVNITNPPDTAIEVAYLALGGDELTNVKVGSFQATAAPVGNQAVAGVGFDPDAVILSGHSRATQNTAGAGDAYLNIGMMDRAGNQGGLSVWSEDAEATSDTARYQRTSKCHVQIWNGGLDREGQFVSMGADGFTINWTTVSGTADWINYIALQGGKYQVGNFLSQTATGTFQKASVGFEPTGAIFESVCSVPAAGIVVHNELSIGFADDARNTIAMGGSDEDNQADTDADRWMYEGSIYRNYDFAQNLDGEIELVGWQSDGFLLNQADADPAQNEIIYLAFGPSPLGTFTEPYRVHLGDPDEVFTDLPDSPLVHNVQGDYWPPPRFP